jgi:phosphomannomutase
MPEIKNIKNEVLSKKVIIFDVDKTLTKSKSPLDNEMAELLAELLKYYKVDIITGGRFGQMKKQIIDYLKNAEGNFYNLYFQPTSGSRLYDFEDVKWREIYKDEIPINDRERIIKFLKEAVRESGVPVPDKMYGERIEDRESQITFSNFGQKAPVEIKQSWDPDKKKRERIIEILKPRLLDYEVSIGGASSIDITKKGINKKYGVEKLSEYLSVPVEEMFFVGDRLELGGNDSSVIETGIDWIDVEDPEETKDIIRDLIKIKG